MAIGGALVRYWKSRRSCLLIPMLLVVVSGCSVNMASVRSFSAETQQLAKTVDAQVDDLAASCRRRVDRLETVRPSDPDTVGRYRRTCEQLAAAGRVPRHYNTILAEYGKTLGALANDQAATFTAELGDARDSVAALAGAAEVSGLDPKEIDAGTRVADLISRIATSSVRQRAVGEMLQRRDDVAAICGVLKRYIDPRYVGVLDNEARSLDGLVTDLELKYAANEPIRTRELIREYSEVHRTLQAKSVTAQQTVKALDTLVVTQGKLSDNAGRLDREDVLQSVQSYAKEVHDVVNQWRVTRTGP